MPTASVTAEKRSKNLDLLQVVSFSLGNHQYGADVDQVSEVVRMVEVAEVPKAPPFIEGVINYRGEIIPLLNLRECLGMKKIGYTPKTSILIAKINRQILGVIVDAVSQVLTVEKSLIEDTPEIHPFAEVLEGVAKLEDELLLLLDLNRVLKKEEKKWLEKVAKPEDRKMKDEG